MPSQEASEDGQQRNEHMPVPLPQPLDAPDDPTATDAETSRQAPQPAKKALKCRNCAQEFSSRSGLWKHLKKPLKQCSQGLRDAMQQHYDTVAGMSDEAHRTLVRLVRRELPTTDPSRDPEQPRVPRCRFCGWEAKSSWALNRHLQQPRRTCTEALRSKIKEIEEARDGAPLTDDELAEVRRSVLSTSVIKKRKKKGRSNDSASQPHYEEEEGDNANVDSTASSVTANSPEAGEAAGGEEDNDEEVIVLEQCRFCGQHVQRLLRHQNKASACRVQRLAAEASIDPASTQELQFDSAGRLICPFACTARIAQFTRIRRHVEKYHAQSPLKDAYLELVDAHVEEKVATQTQQRQNSGRRGWKCHECDGLLFLKTRAYLKHREKVHGKPAETLYFEDQSEFRLWLTKTTGHSYAIRSSSKASSKEALWKDGTYGEVETTLFYACSRDKTSKVPSSHKPTTKRARRHSIKTVRCSSRIYVDILKCGRCICHYYPTHSHALDYRMQNLPSDVIDEVLYLLAQKHSTSSIISKMRSVHTPNDRGYYLSMKDVGNIRRRAGMDIQHFERLSKNDLESIRLHCDRQDLHRRRRKPSSDMKTTVAPTIRFFKAAGDKTVYYPRNMKGLQLPRELFALIVQTDGQRRHAVEALKLEDNSQIFIDATHGTNRYKYSLFTIMVRRRITSTLSSENSYKRYPIAFMFTNSKGARIAGFFMKMALLDILAAEKAPLPKLITSDDDVAMRMMINDLSLQQLQQSQPDEILVEASRDAIYGTAQQHDEYTQRKRRGNRRASTDTQGEESQHNAAADDDSEGEGEEQRSSDGGDEGEQEEEDEEGEGEGDENDDAFIEEYVDDNNNDNEEEEQEEDNDEDIETEPPNDDDVDANDSEVVQGEHHRFHHLLCRFHVMQAFLRKSRALLRDNTERRVALYLFTAMVRAKAEAVFREVQEYFLTMFRDRSKLIKYYKRQYSQRALNWTAFARPKWASHTTNYIESFHSAIKHKYPHMRSNKCRVDEAVNNLIEFVTHLDGIFETIEFQNASREHRQQEAMRLSAGNGTRDATDSEIEGDTPITDNWGEGNPYIVDDAAVARRRSNRQERQITEANEEYHAQLVSLVDEVSATLKDMTIAPKSAVKCMSQVHRLLDGWSQQRQREAEEAQAGIERSESLQVADNVGETYNRLGNIVAGSRSRFGGGKRRSLGRRHTSKRSKKTSSESEHSRTGGEGGANDENDEAEGHNASEDESLAMGSDGERSSNSL